MAEAERIIEKIGKVSLDLTKYPGEDFYCDGAVEDELLEIVKITLLAENPLPNTQPLIASAIAGTSVR